MDASVWTDAFSGIRRGGVGGEHFDAFRNVTPATNDIRLRAERRRPIRGARRDASGEPVGGGRGGGGGGGQTTQNVVGARGKGENAAAVRKISCARNHDLIAQSGTLRAAACVRPPRRAVPCRHEGCRRISRVVERRSSPFAAAVTRGAAPPLPPRAPIGSDDAPARALAPRAGVGAPARLAPRGLPRDRPPRRVAIADRRAGAADRDRAAFAPLPRSPPPPHPRAPRGGVLGPAAPPRRRAPGADDRGLPAPLVRRLPRRLIRLLLPGRDDASRVPGGDAAAAGHRHELSVHGQGGVRPRARLQRQRRAREAPPRRADLRRRGPRRGGARD